MSFIELKTKDIKKLKKQLHTQNNGICPLLGISIPMDKTVLDHIHKLKSDEYAKDKGTIRNAIEFRANLLEGKISNNWKRLFGTDETTYPIDLPSFLRNLADYLEAGAFKENENYYIHPSEVKKAKKIKKLSYNKMVKEFKLTYPNRKVPEYPKSNKLTKTIDKFFKEFNIQNFYYKS